MRYYTRTVNVGRFTVVMTLSSSYNRVVKIGSLHGWRVSPSQALELQLRLASRVSRTNELTSPRYIAGVDISVDRARGMGRGAVVVLSYLRKA